MANMSDDINDAGSASGGSGGAGSGADGSSAGGGPDAGGSGGKKLERKLSGRWLAGVCVGLADYTGVDVSLIRVIFAVLTLFGGAGPIAYIVAWALMPEEGERVSIAEKFINKNSGAGV
jgi:phage shock protein PspC (stress-responsive transcriptional regulator)